jgi:glycosyltransferase involved in cell wall biosynthesis
MKTVIHVTHEAVQKIGGIGAVLHGLLTSKNYSEVITRDILLGPLFTTDGPAESRLHGGEVLYSSIDGIVGHPYGQKFSEIERRYGVNIVYGRKVFYDQLTGVKSDPEVLLVDVRHFNAQKIGELKFMLFEDYGIESQHYDHIWDYEQYCRLALPGLDALHAIGACTGTEPPVILSHEYMGMPTALAARSFHKGMFRTIFYAHEVATMRRLVEHNPGHDTMFYNVLDEAHKQGLNVEQVFGSQRDFYKHPLVEASRYCDNIFAVGDYVIKELRFLNDQFEDHPIDLAYNGVPSFKLTVKEKLASRDRLRQYCENLLGYRPDYVFTHVTRLVPSKGLWRDIRVMEHMEKILRADNKTAVLFVLSTETLGRWPGDVLNMEATYKWPVAHREGHPDLTGGEAAFYAGVQEFNARSRNGKITYINQFGFDRKTCGNRMPPEMEFLDIRKGSDAEFGQSIYEPFGIAQVEPISFGGICVFTNVCGCAGFVRHVTGNKPTPNVIEADYTVLKDLKVGHQLEDLKKIDKAQRDWVENCVSKEVAEELYKRLPTTEAGFARIIDAGYELAHNMSWEAVARDYVLPGIQRALQREQTAVTRAAFKGS